MIRAASRALFVLGLFVSALFAHGSTALAIDDAVHAAQQIDEIVAQADTDMQQVVDQFAVDAPTAATQIELNQMERQALLQIRAVGTTAKAALAVIGRAYPELGFEVGQAFASVSALTNAYRADISAIANATTPGATTTTTIPPPTTTTTTPTTTTTTTPTTTTTTTPTTTTTTTPTTTTTTTPTTTTTTVPPPTTTTTTPTTTTTTDPSTIPPPAPGSGQPPGGDSGQTPAVGGPIDQALAPVNVFETAEESIESDDAATAAGLSGSFEGALSVVLPPQIASAIVSPLIVLELLMRLLFDGVEDLVPPALLLAVAFIWMLRQGRRREEPIPGQAATGAE